jgi:hydrogenase maturation factor
MCQIAVGKVLSASNGKVRVKYKGNVCELNSKLVDLKEGDYALFSSGIAIEKMDKEEAEQLGT